MKSAFASYKMGLPRVCVVPNTTSSNLPKRTVGTSRFRKLPDNSWHLELERYSDRYRPSLKSRPVLKRKDLNPAFFPPDIFEDYFNPRRKRKGASLHPDKPPTFSHPYTATNVDSTKKLNLDDMIDENDEVS